MAVSESLEPRYPNKPIYSVQSLACDLGVSERTLRRIAAQSSKLYRPSSSSAHKSDGSVRQTFDAKPPLKKVQKRINARIFARVFFPAYLNGSIRDPVNPRNPTSNVAPHCEARVIFTEDVKGFFPSISREVVYGMWTGLFGFGSDVALILTDLTTYQGFVPEGAPTSSYVANLALWDVEASVVEALQKRGFQYTRYVDDITVSARHYVERAEKTDVVRQIHGMLRRKGCILNRTKHYVGKKGGSGPRGEPLTVTGLNASGKLPGVPKVKRRRTRAAVGEVERRARAGVHDPEIVALYRSAEGRARQLAQHGYREGQTLLHRLGVVWPSVIQAQNAPPTSSQ